LKPISKSNEGCKESGEGILMKSAADIFTETLLEDRYKVCGRMLHRFTIGHAQLFLHFKLETITSAADLALAVLVCSMPAEKFCQLYAARTWPLRVWWHGLKVGRLATMPGRLDRELALWREYYNYSTTCPDFEPGSKVEEVEPGASFIFHLRSTLISRLHFNPETVDRVILRRAWAEYVVLLEADNQARVLPGVYGENIAARFAEADKKHDERVAQFLKAVQNGHHGS
jgi:hypothetical protein